MITEPEILQANILIVDDIPTNVQLLKKILASAGYKNIFSTSDSREALPLYLDNNIDLLLLDIRMPHLSGFDVMEQLKESTPNDYLPIMVLTAELTHEIRLQSLAGGAKDFLTKPFERLETLQRIRNILEVRLLHKKASQQNEELEKKVQIRTQQLESSRYEVIQCLGLAAEYKDNETGNHILRMSYFSKLLALAAGISKEESEAIFNAAPMHDIGKIGIPDRVLLKPGKLDAEEWKIMQSHVEIGAHILSGSNSLLMITAKEIALTHHERWDGAGYPNGLSGEDIPISGRICAICDVFDALTSERPYKEAWPIDKAMQLLRDEKGKQFDPELVSIFESILDEVLLFRDQHIDSTNSPKESKK